MKKIITCSLFGIFLFFLSSTSWAVIDLSLYYEPDMNDGYTWTYIENGLNYVTQTVLPGVTYLNGIAYKAQKTSGGEQSGSIAYYWGDSTGYAIARVFVPDTFVSGYGFVDSAVDFIPPKKCPPYVNEGDIITLSGNVNLTYSGLGTYPMSYTDSFKVIGFENITVPFGNYDALKIQEVLTTAGYITGQYLSVTVTQTSWFIPYVGAIKITVASDYQNIARELTNINFSVPSSDRPPIGHVDYVNERQVAGWAYDPDDPNQSVDVHVYIDGNIIDSTTANLERPDLDLSYPYHGFCYSLPELSPGTHSIKVYAINLDSTGTNPLLEGPNEIEIPVVNNGCAMADENLTITIPCAVYNAIKYRLTLELYSNPANPFGTYWKLADAQTATCDCAGECAIIDEELNIDIPCVEYGDSQFMINLKRYNNIHDSLGFYWELGSVDVK